MKRLLTVKTLAILTAIVLVFSLCAGGCSRQAVVDEMGNSNPISIDTAPVTEYVDDAGNPVLPEWQGGTGISEAELERYGAEYAQKVIDNAQSPDQNKSTPQIPDIIPKDPALDSPAKPSDSGGPKTEPDDSGESTSPQESLPQKQDENLPVTTNEYYSLPVMSIDTGGAAIVSKSEYINAKVTITNTDANNCITEVTAGIRGRGNSTWALFDKKPYRIRFDSNIDLFGMGKARSYVLLSNNMDMTLMRNYLAFKLSDIMEIEFNSGYQWINVYLNGEYAGLYLLTEQVQTGNNRVDIDPSTVGALDTGYLVELDGTGNAEGHPYFRLNKVENRLPGVANWRDQFVCTIKGPDQNVNKQQVEYIKDYIDRANAAILTGNWQQMTALLDIDSFVNAFLVNSFLLNSDAGWQFYVYKKQGGKLHLGPIWDFDQSMGSSTHGGTGYTGWLCGTVFPWGDALLQIPEFMSLVKERYNQKLPQIKELVPIIDQCVNDYSFDIAMNNLRWPIMGTDYWRCPPEFLNKTDYQWHTDFLKSWLTNRLEHYTSLVNQL